jgi:proline racemase
MGPSCSTSSGRPNDGSLHQRNVTIFADGEVDRSPCGSGSAARVAVLAACGELGPGRAPVHDSIVGSSFTCRVVASLTADGHPAVVPQITGMAYRCGTSEFTLDRRDPFNGGKGRAPGAPGTRGDDPTG